MAMIFPTAGLMIFLILSLTKDAGNYSAPAYYSEAFSFCANGGGLK